MKNNKKKEIKINNKKFIYEIIIPWWNSTALVELEKDYKISNLEKKEINNKIMAENMEVEQVWFIYNDIENPKLEMAWWEFCWNAVRSAVYKYFKDYWVKIKDIRVFGIEKKLNVFLESKLGKVISWTEMPIYTNPKNIKKIEENIYIVKMDWITHIVIENMSLSNLSIEEIKSKAMKKMEEFQEKYIDLKNIPCLGVIYIESNSSLNKKIIKPIVFVRSINTIFYETACWSWTCAVWMVEALKKWKNINLDVLQPSWFIISVKVEYDWNNFWNAYIKWLIN